jgi:hypothetical protein
MKVNCYKDEVLMGADENEPQGCNIIVGSWTYDGFHLNLTAYGKNAPGCTFHCGIAGDLHFF